MAINFKNKLLATTAGNIVVIAVALLSINFVASKVNFKLDFTQGGLYTLSSGSKKIVKAIDDDAVVKYYFSASNAGLPIVIKNYGNRVKELLQEFVSYNSSLTLEVYDPKPDSDEEEAAIKFGINGAQAGEGGQFYMGAVILYHDKQFTVPFFDPRRESFMEYEIASLFAKINQKGGKILGILAGFALGAPPMPNIPGMPRQPQQDDWAFVKELRKLYEVKILDRNLEEIPSDINLLLVLHPKDISEKTEYAIDQFILNQGKVALIVDPSATTVQGSQNPQMQQYGMPNSSTSDLKKVFETLQIKYDSKKIVVDENHAARVQTGRGSVQYPVWLHFNNDGFNKDLIATSELRTGLFVEAGAFESKQGGNVKYMSLISTGNEGVGTIDKFRAKALIGGNADYNKENSFLSIAGVVTGKFKSAFKGKPKDSKFKAKHISEAAGDNTVLLVGDVDFLNNRYSLQMMNFFGQQIARPMNHNLAFLSNSLEFLGGNPELISIRSRGTFQRPFTKVREIQKDAQARWFTVEKDLNQRVQQLQSELSRMQRTRTDQNQLNLSVAQQEEVRKFKVELATMKGKRREVRKNLRQDIEGLGTTLTLLNMFIMPILILILGMYIYFRRTNGLPVFKRRAQGA